MTKQNKMICVLGHNSALEGYIRPAETLANAMNFRMNHAPDAGSIAWPVEQQPVRYYWATNVT